MAAYRIIQAGPKWRLQEQYRPTWPWRTIGIFASQHEAAFIARSMGLSVDT